MTEIIALSAATIGGEEIQTVNARDLHAFLGVKTEFKDWIARRIKDFGFVENTDFCSFLSESSGGRPSKEFSVSLGMAKELAMVERNAKGKQARLYFILAIRRKPVRIAMPSEHGRSTDLFARTVVTERTATSMEVGICNVWVVC